MRVMLDTDTPAELTKGSKVRAPILATYADLVGAVMLAQLRASWAQVLLIDRGLGDPLGKASIIDVERGTHSAADAPAWYDRQHKAGVKYLTVYANRASQGAANAAMGKRPFYRWIATLDGTAHVPPYAAKSEDRARELPPFGDKPVNATEAVTAICAIMRAADLNFFDLQMWYRRGQRD